MPLSSSVTLSFKLVWSWRFLELGSILEPGKQPKMDKAAILSDAARMVTQLRMEAQKLKDSNENLQEKIKELKVRMIFSLSYMLLLLESSMPTE